MLPPDAVLSHLRAVDLSDVNLQKVRNGVSIEISRPEWGDGEQVRLRDEHRHLVAVASFEAEKNLLRPRVVLAPDER